MRAGPPPPSLPTLSRTDPAYLATLVLTALNSIATGVVTSGIFFLTRQGYGFSELQNYLLAAVIGITYVLGAAGAGPLVRWLRAHLSTRTLVLGLLVAMAGLCALPAWAGPWVVWVLVALYSPLAGTLWPIVESYVSGGRAGEVLRKGIGTWNVVWSASLVVAYLAIAPFCEAYPAATLLVLGGVQLVSTAALVWLPREPLAHGPAHVPEPAAPSAGSGEDVHLLAAFRFLLPTSYMVLTVLGPFLPSAMERLGIARELQTVVATAWLLPRALAFAGLAGWHEWHGRWWFPAVGGTLLVGGFALAMGASWLATGPAGVVLLVLGLIGFGLGMAAIYKGALYYVMEVGQSEVGAGGSHETLIGLGYSVGPLLGLGAAAAVQRGWLAAEDLELGVLVPTAVLGVAGLAYAWRIGHRRVRSRSG